MISIEERLNKWAIDSLSEVKEIRDTLDSAKDPAHAIRQLYIDSHHDKMRMWFLTFVVHYKYPQYKPILEKLIILE